MKILKYGILVVALATGVFADGSSAEIKEPSKIWVGVGFSDFNTYRVNEYDIENNDFNEHSQGLSISAGYNFYEYNDWEISGEVRLGQSSWNQPLNIVTSDLLLRTTYHFGYFGVYALGGISYQDFNDYYVEKTGPALGLGLVGMVTDHASVFFDYIGKPMDIYLDRSADYVDYVDGGVATVGIRYSF